MAIGEICFISGLYCREKHNIYWGLHDSVEGERIERGKVEKLSDLYRFQYQGGICLKRKGDEVFSGYFQLEYKELQRLLKRS